MYSADGEKSQGFTCMSGCEAFREHRHHAGHDKDGGHQVLVSIWPPISFSSLAATMAVVS